MQFSAIVKDVRERLHLSQEQLARELNVSFSTINRWEHGKSKPSQMAKKLFCDFCVKNKIDLNPLEEGEL